MTCHQTQLLFFRNTTTIDGNNVIIHFRDSKVLNIL